MEELEQYVIQESSQSTKAEFGPRKDGDIDPQHGLGYLNQNYVGTPGFKPAIKRLQSQVLMHGYIQKCALHPRQSLPALLETRRLVSAKALMGV